MTEPPEKTRRAARRLRFATLAAIALLEAAILAGIALLLSGARGAVPAIVVHDSGLPAWPAAAILLVVGLFLGLALLRLVRLLGRVEAGAPFGVAGELRGFAFWLLLAILVSILGPPVLQAAFVLAGEGRRVQLSLGNDSAVMLLVTGLLFLVARLLDQAQALADDHSQIV